MYMRALTRSSISLFALVGLFSFPLVAQQGAPTGLHATASGPTTVSLTWTAAANASRYWVQRAVGSASLVNLPAPKITGTTYTDATAPAGTALRYRVMA